MLGSNREITVVQMVVVMTIVGLLGIWIGTALGQQNWRNQQREHDLNIVAGVINRYPVSHMGSYPDTAAADSDSSQLQQEFASLRLIDPSTGEYYILGSNFGTCNGPAATDQPGLGYMSYEAPGQDGSPYDLRVCLEGGGDYYAAD